MFSEAFQINYLKKVAENSFYQNKKKKYSACFSQELLEKSAYNF